MYQGDRYAERRAPALCGGARPHRVGTDRGASDRPDALRKLQPKRDHDHVVGGLPSYWLDVLRYATLSQAHTGEYDDRSEW